MEIVDPNSSVLSNYEVYSTLQQLKQSSIPSKSSKGKQNSLATITYEILSHLESTPCKHQTPEMIEEFLKAVIPFNLTKSEKLTLLNNRPTSDVEIQLMIEESEERLSDSQAQELLQVINTTLPLHGVENETNDSDGLNA